MQKSRSGLGVSPRERSLVCDFLTHHRVHHLQFPLYLPYPLSHNTGGFLQYTTHLCGVRVISSGFIPHYLPYPLSHNTGGFLQYTIHLRGVRVISSGFIPHYLHYRLSHNTGGFLQYTIHLCLLVPINIIN